MPLLSSLDITQLLAPRRCLLCGEPDTRSPCPACRKGLEPIADHGCRRCHNPAVHEESADCDWCRRLKVLPGKFCSFYAYRNKGRDALHLVKYQGYWRLIESLVRFQAKAFFEALPFPRYQALVPIPESFARKWRRSFNPAQRIALSLSRYTGLPIRSGLRMAPFRRRQVGLEYEERRRNVRDRFRVRPKRLPASVILVDDVLTTGATLEAATKSLYQAGVRDVAWLTLFRTL